MSKLSPITDGPTRSSYDVVIVGGAMTGSAIAWFLAGHFDFDGTVLVVERDTTYTNASTTHTNSCMRQQFSNRVNIEMSRFAAEFVRDFRSFMGDPDAPDVFVQHFGYMYLAGDEASAEVLRANQAVQAQFGAATRTMSPEEIKAEYPFYNVDDLVCGNHNVVDEGYFDGGTVFDWFRRSARTYGVEYTRGEVVDVERSGERITGVRLATGERVQCGTLVNAAGPRAVEVAKMAGFELPVEPRKRFTFVFNAAEPLDRPLPLTVDPSGVHVRTDGDVYMAGCAPDHDPAVDYDDFAIDGDIFETKVWPALANRIPAFERIKVTSQWAGHYVHNRLDQNVVVGAHPAVDNFVFANGFSGHGLQQSPAIGRGVAELISFGEFRSLELGELGYQRILAGEPFLETAVI